MSYRIDARPGDKAVFDGRIITVLESLLTHADPGDGLVDKGQPIVCGCLVGVAGQSALKATDYVPVDTEGVYYLAVSAGKTVAVGQNLFITSAGLITDIPSATSRSFGYALQEIIAESPVIKVIPVKVHFEAGVNNGE